MKIQELLQQYGPADPPTKNDPPAFRSRNTVQAFTHGREYFQELSREINRLTRSTTARRYFYLTAWWLGLVAAKGEFRLSSKALAWKAELKLQPMRLPNGPLLLDALQQMAESGVDVRILAWCDPYVPNVKMVSQQSGLLAVNLHTLLSVQSLRKAPRLAKRVMLNTRCHPLGAAHTKLVVCGDQRRMQAYVSGLDPEASRIASAWQDAGVMVQGQAAKGCYDFFQHVWREQRSQKPLSFTVNQKNIVSHATDYPEIPERPMVSPRPVDHRPVHVQVLRTVPAMHFSPAGPQQIPHANWVRRLFAKDGAVSWAGLAPWRRPPISFAPEGLFDFSLALRKAIAQAKHYIFIADQAFKSLETMDWINRQLRARPNLKVILLYGADPSDPPNEFIVQALNEHLIRGLDQATIDRRIAYFEWRGVTVHSKVTIIDDVWCAVGSANCMRRSHYTDIELSLGILDPTWVRDFRRRLWSKFMTWQTIPEEQARSFANLRIWHPEWRGPSSPNARRHPDILPNRLPLARPLWCLEAEPPPHPCKNAAGLWYKLDPDSRRRLIKGLDGYLRKEGKDRKISRELLDLEMEAHRHGSRSTPLHKLKLRDLVELDELFTVEVFQPGQVWLLQKLRKRFVNRVIWKDPGSDRIRIYPYFSDPHSNLEDPDSRQTF